MVRYRSCKHILLHNQLKLLKLPSKSFHGIRGYKSLAYGNSEPENLTQSTKINDDERHGALPQTYFHTLLSQKISYIDPELTI